MNSLVPEWCGNDIKSMIIETILAIDILSTSCEIAPR